MLSHLLLENFSEARLLGILLVLIGKLVLIHRELLMGYSSNYSFLNRLPLFLSFVCLFMCVWVVCVVIFCVELPELQREDADWSVRHASLHRVCVIQEPH